MLTDVAIKALDRDGIYVHLRTKGALSFRMDYRLNGRRETIYLGNYGPDGLSLARAREKCIDARRACRWDLAGDRKAARGSGV
jgi:Arm DNA-binding domain